MAEPGDTSGDSHNNGKYAMYLTVSQPGADKGPNQVRDGENRLMVHVNNERRRDGIPAQGQMYGLPEARSFTPTRWLGDGDTVTLGETEWKVVHCPGHTPGHVVFFHEGTRHAFVGDVLFAGSIGRTDFPQGNHADLINAIKTKLLPLGDDVTFTPGHGPESTFGEERRYNPFLQAR